MHRRAPESFGRVLGTLTVALLLSSCGDSGGATASANNGGGAGAADDTRDGSPNGGASPGGDANGGQSPLVNPEPGSKFFVGGNFWRIDWEGTADFFLPDVDWATVSNPWQPQLLADLAPHSVLRFMDWNLTNDDPNPQATWSTRKQKAESQSNEPIAFEWQLDLCNRTLKDCWLNVPIQANATFQKSLAQLAYDTLDPRLRLYVEYSNEVWNGGFPQAGIALQNADQLGLPAEANSCCEIDTIKTGNAYVYGSVRLFEQFESVFGTDNARLVKVLSGQAAWDGPCQVHMAALQNATINPNGTMPSVYAIAPYFGGESIAALQAAIADTASWTQSHVACASQLNLPLISYEGGSDSYSAGDGCTTLQHDAGMYDLYTQYYEAQAEAGMTGPFVQYTHVGSCWGLKEKTSDTTANSPKYRAVVDWVAAHP